MNGNLVSDFWADLSAGQPDETLPWQISALVICLSVSWVIARVLRNRLLVRGGQVCLVRVG